MADTSKEVSTAEVNNDSDNGALEHGTPEHHDEKPYSWFRGVFFQATIVGLCAFGAPGLWNAMQSVGAGGQQTPYLVM